MRLRASRVAACTTTAALAASALVAVAAGGASAAPPGLQGLQGLQGDFNGDGYRDVATAAPNTTVNGKRTAGSIAVAHGSPAGLKPGKSAISQNSPGVAGTAEGGDRFGETVHTGDFDGDGYADLAVGAPGEDVGTDKNGGSVQILWGSASGLSGGTDVPDPAPAEHDKSGQSLAAGDFDGDGTTDLAIGSTGSKVWIVKGGMTRTGGNGGTYPFTAPIWTDGAGAFALTAGDVNGDRVTDLVVNGLDPADGDTNANFLFLGSRTGPKSPARLPGGLASAVADFDGDGFGDVATGNHWEPSDGVPGSVKGGRVTVRHGSAAGLDPARPARHIDQQTPGVPGTSETGDAFGSDLSAGDIDKDGRADLVVGVPGEGIGGESSTGDIIVLKGGAAGLSGTGAKAISQGTAGVPGKNEWYDLFGSSVLVSDVTRDGHADITVGGMGENGEAGALWGLRGSASGVTTSGARNITPAALGFGPLSTPMIGTDLTG